MANRWFRMHADAVDDGKLRLIAFEDRWHFVAILCLKAEGLLDTDSANRDRLIAVKLGLTVREADEVRRRLCEVGLIEEDWQPIAWDKRQYLSDNSSDRVKKYREKRRANGLPAAMDYSVFRQALFNRDGSTCVYCGTDQRLVVDHMVPINQGGTDEIDNLALACKGCNAGKAGRTPEEAGLVIIGRSTAEALKRYRDLSRHVTVTETPSETDTDTEAEAERKKGSGAVALVPVADLDVAVSDWNEMAARTGLPAVQRMTTARKSHLRNRLAECGGLEGWRAALEKLAASSFCRGDSKSGWSADFDFILQAKSFTKLMEGGYDNRTGENRSAGAAAAVAGILAAAN